MCVFFMFINLLNCINDMISIIFLYIEFYLLYCINQKGFFIKKVNKFLIKSK